MLRQPRNFAQAGWRGWARQAYLAEALKAEDSAQLQLVGVLGGAETAELNELLTLIVTDERARC